MKKQRDLFSDIEHLIAMVSFLIVSTLGFVVFVMLAVKHVVDYWKLLW